MQCTKLVRGSIYSRKGGNRYDDCPHAAKFKVTSRGIHSWTEHVCGIHVRSYNIFNASLWRTDDTLKRPRRAAFYLVEALEGEAHEPV